MRTRHEINGAHSAPYPLRRKLFRKFSNYGGNMASKYHLENSLIDVAETDIPRNKQGKNSPHESQCALLEAAYGLWQNQPIDGLVYQAQIRAEWNYPL